MARKTNLNKDKRQSIVTLRNESIQKISWTLNVSPSSVTKYYEETGSHEDHPRKGRPRATSAEDKIIGIISLRNHLFTAPQITAHIKASGVHVADIFQHPLFRGHCVSQAFMVKETNCGKETITLEEQQVEKTFWAKNGHLISGYLSFGLMSLC